VKKKCLLIEEIQERNKIKKYVLSQHKKCQNISV